MTQYTSELHFPAGGASDTVTVEVDVHADIPTLEPHFLSIKRNNRDREQIVFHRKEDFEAFLDNLLDAADEAYDEPPVVSSVEFTIDTSGFTTALEAFADAIAELTDETETETEEVNYLEGDPATPAEQQEAFRRVIEKEVSLMRHNAEHEPEDELVPLVVNGECADAIHKLAEQAGNYKGTRMDLLITEQSL